MKCNNIRKDIDRMVYPDEPDPGTEFYHHIESCKACSRYLEEARLVAGKIAGISRREPVLKNPEGLTEGIMQAIRFSSDKNHEQKVVLAGKNRGIIILKRLLAAASVCLFLVFGYEEYIVVDKISRLEKQNAAISRNSQYQAALKLKKAMSILVSDTEMLIHNKEFKPGKINLTTSLRAAICADVAGLTPDVLKLLNRADFDVTDPSYLNILKKF